jgi:hypothetical protein
MFAKLMGAICGRRSTRPNCNVPLQTTTEPLIPSSATTGETVLRLLSSMPSEWQKPTNTVLARRLRHYRDKAHAQALSCPEARLQTEQMVRLIVEGLTFAQDAVDARYPSPGGKDALTWDEDEWKDELAGTKGLWWIRVFVRVESLLRQNSMLPPLAPRDGGECLPRGAEVWVRPTRYLAAAITEMCSQDWDVDWRFEANQLADWADEYPGREGRRIHEMGYAGEYGDCGDILSSCDVDDGLATTRGFHEPGLEDAESGADTC